MRKNRERQGESKMWIERQKGRKEEKRGRQREMRRVRDR